MASAFTEQFSAIKHKLTKKSLTIYLIFSLFKSYVITSFFSYFCNVNNNKQNKSYAHEKILLKLSPTYLIWININNETIIRVDSGCVSKKVTWKLQNKNRQYCNLLKTDTNSHLESRF